MVSVGLVLVSHKHQLVGNIDFMLRNSCENGHLIIFNIIITQLYNKMKSTSVSQPKKSLTRNSKPISLSKKQQSQPPQPTPAPPVNTISRQNYDLMHKKFNITEIQPLEVKYVLKCRQGMFKDRFLYITTHKDGEIIGGGKAKQHGLTLQIEGVGLADKHAKLKFNGLDRFFVTDYGTTEGTWLRIPSDGLPIHHNDQFHIQNLHVKFEYSHPINQIQQLCLMHGTLQLSDLLVYNGIQDIPALLQAQYNKFKGYPFQPEALLKLNKMCQSAKQFYSQDNPNKCLNMHYLNQQLAGLSEQIGWVTKYLYSDPLTSMNPISTITNANSISTDDQPLAHVALSRLHPHTTTNIFSKITPARKHQIKLHDCIKMGQLVFELMRFNAGLGQRRGAGQEMEDCWIMEQDVGGSQWKLVSLFGVVDGYGGSECMLYIRDKLVAKIRQWTHLLDEASDLNQMLKLLMSKTYHQLDQQFHSLYPQLSLTCGATLLVVLLIDSRAYAFNLGDNHGYLHRDGNLYKLALQHLPTRIDEKTRIQAVGGCVQYGRLQGKCTISRALGQFQYKIPMQLLSCMPEVLCFDLDADRDQFLLLSTDGLFQNSTIEYINQYIMERSSKLEGGESPGQMLSALMEGCALGVPGCDDMAVVVVFLRRGRRGGGSGF